MSDVTKSDDTSSTDSHTQREFFPTPDIDTHDYRKVDQTQLLSTESCTAYQLTLECQDLDCYRTATPILVEGDLPETTEDVETLMYEIYQWFYDNSGDIPSAEEYSPHYQATFPLIPGSKASRELLPFRVWLFLAADTGYEDGRHGVPQKRKRELVRRTKDLTEQVLSQMEAVDDPILEEYS